MIDSWEEGAKAQREAIALFLERSAETGLRNFSQLRASKNRTKVSRELVEFSAALTRMAAYEIRRQPLVEQQ